MPVICKNHFKNLSISHQLCEIVFNPQFSNLFEELQYIYKNYSLNETEKEAFQDAIYCFIAQEDHDQMQLSSALHL